MLGATAHVVLFLGMVQPVTANVPSPQPTPLREIGHVRSSLVCGALGSLVLPIALVVQRNDRDFTALREPIARFAGGQGLGFDAAQNPVLAADPNTPANTDLNGNDENEYTPVRTISASNIDRLTNQVLTNLADADRVMSQSWKAHPAHVDPGYDALRRRVQNVIDLQRVLAFRMDDVAGAYFSNVGGSGSFSNADKLAFNRILGNTIDTQLAQDVDAEYTIDVDPSNLPVGDVSALKNGSAGDIAVGLRIQKLALSLEAQHIAKSCDAQIPIPAPTLAP